MPQITLDIPQSKYAFFMELIKSLSFIKKSAVQNVVTIDDEDERSRTKEELVADFKEALQEVADIRAGKKKAQTLEEFLNEL